MSQSWECVYHTVLSPCSQYCQARNRWAQFNICLTGLCRGNLVPVVPEIMGKLVCYWILPLFVNTRFPSFNRPWFFVLWLLLFTVCISFIQKQVTYVNMTILLWYATEFLTIQEVTMKTSLLFINFLSVQRVAWRTYPVRREWWRQSPSQAFFNWDLERLVIMVTMKNGTVNRDCRCQMRLLILPSFIYPQ
jgi:hypothetical protein